ncbi:MAG: hypothetical protein AAGF29_08375 [Pseudomonadota bacterium]
MTASLSALAATPYLPAAFAIIALAVLFVRDVTTGPLARILLVITCAVAAFATSLGNLMIQFLLLEVAWASAVLAIWLGGGERAYRCGVRVAMWHIVSGALVLAGIAFTFGEAEIAGSVDLASGWAPWLLFVGLGIRAGFPLAHIWPVDVATNSSRLALAVAATVLPASALSLVGTFFAGEESLVWIGAAMIAIGALYALLERDRNIRTPYLIGGLFGLITILIGLSSTSLIGYGLAAAVVIGGGIALFVGEERSKTEGAGSLPRKHVPDFDIIMLRVVPAIFFFTLRFGLAIWEEVVRGGKAVVAATLDTAYRIYGPEGRASQLMATGTMVLWLAILLFAALSVNLLNLI